MNRADCDGCSALAGCEAQDAWCLDFADDDDHLDIVGTLAEAVGMNTPYERMTQDVQDALKTLDTSEMLPMLAALEQMNWRG